MKKNRKSMLIASLANSSRMMVMMLVLYSGYQLLTGAHGSAPEPEPIPVEEEEYLPAPPTFDSPDLIFPAKSILDRLNYAFGLSFCTHELKALVQACDNLKVRNQALDIIADDNPDGLDLADIADLYDFVYTDWNYVDDPPDKDHVFPASESIQHLKGDCDDFAALLCSLVSSIGGQTRVNYVYNGGGHAYTEVCIGAADIDAVAHYLRKRYRLPSDTPIYFEKDTDGKLWLPLDWWEKYPGGKPFEYVGGYRFYVFDRYCEEL